MGVTKTNQNHLAPRIHINEGTLFCDLSHYCYELYANGQLFLVSLMHTFYLTLLRYLDHRFPFQTFR